MEKIVGCENISTIENELNVTPKYGEFHYGALTYDVQLLTRFDLNFELHENPKIHAIDSAVSRYIAIDKMCLINDAKSGYCDQAVELGFRVNCIAVCEEGDFLVAGSDDGRLSVTYTPQNKCLFTHRFLEDNSVNENIGICGVIFTSKDSKTGMCEIVIVSNAGHVFILNNVHLGELRQKLCDSKNETFKPVLEIVEIEIPMICNHLSYSHNLDQHLILLSGDGIKILSNGKVGQEFEIIHTKDKDAFFEQEVVKSAFCSKHRYAVLLDASKTLHVLCLKTFIIMEIWNVFAVEDFTLFENFSRNFDTCILMKVKIQEQFNLQLYYLSTFQMIYSFQIYPSTILFQLTLNSENILLLDLSNENLENTNYNGVVHSIVETNAHSRLLRLIAKKNFEEAIQFAHKFNLDLEVVYIGKVTDLLEQIRMYNEGESARESLSLLYEYLDHLTDLNLLINSSIEAALPTLEDTKELLQYVISKIKSNFEFDSEILKKLFTTWRKLETFELINKATYESLSWEQFKTADLFDEMRFWLRNDNISIVSLIWARHSQELVSQLNKNHIAQFLESIPEIRIPVTISEWLRRSFLPFVLLKIKDTIEVVASWILYRCYMMEVDTIGWPNNALHFANMFVEVCQDLAVDQNLANFDYIIDLAVLMNLEANGSTVSLFRQFRCLLDNLKDLDMLRVKYNCKIPLAHYSQESKSLAVYYLFAYLPEPVVISDFVDNFLTSFAYHNSLTVNSILKSYIQEFLDRNEFAWQFWEEVPWEKPVIAAMNCIKSDDLRLETLCQVLKVCPVPWTQGIRQLAEASLKTNHSLVTFIKNEIAYEAQQVIMRKYCWFHSDVLEQHIGHILIRNIVSSPSADANIVDDALTIASAVHISNADVYFLRMLHLIKTDKMQEYSQFLKSLSLDVAIICCKRLVMFAHGLCEDHCDNEELLIERLNIISVTIHALQFLEQHIPSFDFDEYLIYLDTFLKLRAILELGAALPICLLNSNENSNLFISSCVDSFLLNQSFDFNNWEKVPPSFQNSRKNSKNKQSLCDIFWLGGILNVSVSSIAEILVIKAVKMKNYNLALESCIYICSEDTSSFKVPVSHLKKLIFHVIINLGGENKLSSLWKSFDQLNFALAQAAVSCSPDKIDSFVSIWRWVYLLKHVININDINADFSQCLSQDAYDRWTFSTIMRDTTVYLDSEKIISLISATVQILIEIESGSSKLEDYQNLFGLFMDVIEYLKSRGQILLSHFVTGIYMEILVDTAIQNNLSDSFWNKFHKRASSLVISILKNLFSQRKLDSTLTLGMIMSLPQEDAFSFLNLIEKKCGLDYGKLCIIASLGIEVCDRWKIVDLGSYYSDLVIEAEWGKKLSRFHIKYKDFQIGSPGFTKLDFILQMAKHNKITSSLIKEFATTFGIGNDQTYCTVLKVLLTDREKEADNSKSWEEIIHLCTFISRQILNRNLLLDHLKTIFAKVDPYNYEVIKFLLNLVLQINVEINDEEVVELTNKSLKLLSFLYTYERQNEPSEFEIKLLLEDSFEAKCDLTVCLKRLPFHHLLVPAYSNKLIVKELTLQTYMMWLEMSSIISLSKNNIIMITISNMVEEALPGTSNVMTKSLWEENEVDTQLFTNIHNLLKCIGDLELATVCLISIIRKLSSGIKKILAVEIAIKFSLKWYENGQSEKASSTLKILKNTYRNLCCDQLFHRLKLGVDYTSMRDNPEQMLISILEHPSIEDHHWFATNRLNDLYGVCKQLASIYNFNFDKLCISLLHKWLVPSESTHGGVLDESITVNLDVSQLDENYDDNLGSSEKNLKRAIYLLRKINTEDITKYIVFMLQNSSTSLTHTDKLKYLLCLFHTQTVPNLHLYIGHTVDELRILAKKFYCEIQLESIGMVCLMPELGEKQAINNLIFHLIHTYGHKQTAILLAIDLCFENNIYNVAVWENLLKRMMMLKLIKPLTKSLCQIAVCPEILSSKLYHKSWKFVLSNTVFDEESTGLSALMLIQKCVIFRELNLVDLAEVYKEANMHVLVIRCFLGLDSQHGFNLIKEYVSENLWNQIVKHVIELYNQVGDLYHMNEILMALILSLTGNGFLTRCLQSSHGPWLKSCITEPKNLHRILVIAAKNEMWNESDELILFDAEYQSIVEKRIKSGVKFNAKESIKQYAKMSQLELLINLTSGL